MSGPKGPHRIERDPIGPRSWHVIVGPASASRDDMLARSLAHFEDAGDAAERMEILDAAWLGGSDAERARIREKVEAMRPAAGEAGRTLFETGQNYALLQVLALLAEPQPQEETYFDAPNSGAYPPGV